MREIKFRQAIFHPVTGEFLKWHYWGLIENAFVSLELEVLEQEQIDLSIAFAQ